MTMTNQHADRIARILRDEVLVLIEGGELVGSGFFAAPGFVITCAHVTGANRGRQVKVSWKGGSATGIVRYASAPPTAGARVWPYPDLAVIEVETTASGYRCAWMEQSYPSFGTKLVVLGHSTTYTGTPEITPALVTYEGLPGLQQEKVLQLGGGELPAGMSGGPVLNLATGAVCGIAKSQRKPNSAMGGLAISLKAVRSVDPQLYRQLWRAHDRHHGDGRDSSDWLFNTDLLKPVGVAGLTRAEERQLLRLLTELPEHGDHRAAWNIAAGILAGEPDAPLLDYRDVVDDLSELYQHETGCLPHPVTYAVDIARQTTGRLAEQLKLWAAAVAGRLGLTSLVIERLLADPGVPRTLSVMAELEPASPDQNLVRLNIWRYLDSGQTISVRLDQPPVPAAQAWQELKVALLAELEAAGGARQPVTVEIFVQSHLMDEDVAGWQIWPEQRWAELGRRYPVVMRDLDRRHDPRVLGSWCSRWESLEVRAVGEALLPVDCAKREHAEHEGRIEGDPGLGAIALAVSPFRSATRSALEVALPAGVPVLVWPRRQCHECLEPGGPACPAAAFAQSLADELRQTRLADLPERIRLLRNDAAVSKDGTHCGRDLVLVWDNPHRQPPRTRRTVIGASVET